LRDANTLRFFKEVVNQGHQIGNHTYDHPDAHQLTDQQYADNILRGHHTIVELLGCEPKGFRAPAYYITESSLLTLARLGYFYDSSATFSPLTRGLIRLLEILKKNFKAKTDSKLHKKFSGHGPYCKVVGFV
jgi:peptidoglycan/xylan/chitin deacetylase (PgdA/CDA1 family)